MKAVLLAAGNGTRLRPLTDTMPKCMVPLGGRPLLDVWLDAFERTGVDEVLVNLHHLPDVVRQHVAGRPAVRTSFEPELLGSAGTLVAHRSWLTGEPFFLVCYADNLTDFDLTELVTTHRGGDLPATVAVFRSPNPSAGGVVSCDPSGLVTGFVEKPARPSSDLVNAGIYAFSPVVLNLVPSRRPADIGYDLLPLLVGQAQSVLVGGYFRDIGTPESYRLAQQEWVS